MNLLPILAGCILAISVVYSVNAAPVPAIDFDPGTDLGDPPGPGQYRGYDFGSANAMFGWTFMVEEAITITHLGWYDENGDGLSHEHRLGLWRTMDSVNFDLVVEVTLPIGTGAELAGPWRRAPVSVALLAWKYVIGGLDNSQSTDIVKYVDDSNPLLPLPIDPRLGEITLGAHRFDDMLVFTAPSLEVLAPGLYAGPMFFIEPVPEPGTIALFAMGAILVVPMVRSRMKCKA